MRTVFHVSLNDLSEKKVYLTAKDLFGLGPPYPAQNSKLHSRQPRRIKKGPQFMVMGFDSILALRNM